MDTPVSRSTAELDALLGAFRRSLRARNRSAKTLASYTEAARQFTAFLAAHGRPLDPEAITRADVEDYITDQLERWTPSTAGNRYRALQQWFRWMATEEIIPGSPMAKMSPPSQPEAPVPIFTDDELKRLLKVTAGKGFDARRDHAVIRLFIDSGIRLGEMAGIAAADVDLDAEVILVTGKGDRGRLIPINPAVALALDRYHLERRKHPRADLPALWLGKLGALTDSGIAQLLRRRAVEAGVDGMHAHRFRHTFAHRWLAAGNTEGDLQRLAGWRSPQMLARYGASAADQRARDAYRRSNLWGDV